MQVDDIRPMSVYLLILAILGLIGTPALARDSLQPPNMRAGSVKWMDAVKLSSEGVRADYPSITHDASGTVHILWSEAMEGSPGGFIYYTSVREGIVDSPNSVLYSPSAPFWVTSVVGADGRLHVAWLAGNGDLYYSAARLDKAAAAGAWDHPKVIAGPAAGIALMLARNGLLYLFYSHANAPAVSQIVSADHGCGWSVSELVGEGAGPDERVFAISAVTDESNCFHLVWSQWHGSGWPGTRIYYTRSCEGDSAWATPFEVDSVDSGDFRDGYGPFWGTIMALDRGRLVLVWDGPPNGQRYSRWSVDGGVTWSPPVVLDQRVRGITGFNALATDSSGVLHLLTGGTTNQVGGTGMYYATWQDGIWSPLTLTPVTWAGEFQEITISRGNELHGVWSTHRDVYYQMALLPSAQLPAQAVQVVERPCDRGATPEATRPVRQETPRPSFTPSPALVPSATDVPIASSNPSLALLMGILPVVVLLGAVFVARFFRRRY